MRAFILFILITVALPLQAGELYQTIQERLSLMKEVAAYKWINGQPIEALEREALVIDNAVLSGLNYGITVNSSRAFFTAQINAAKDIQQCWFDRWQTTDAAPTQARDLILEVRPQLLALGAQINKRLAAEQQDELRFHEEISTDCLSEASRAQIFEALASIRVYPDRLAQIKDSGILRVGTTGDYAPFSFSADDENFQGIDIDLALALSEHLGAELKLVQTSWPNLMMDLAEGRYDVGMSGISRIPAREEQAYFSQAYHVGGKTPITRCQDADRFSSLEKIDQPETRVIVNPGGTNERFLDANITQAKKVLHDDNRTIFDQIVNAHADVMVTDLIEAQLHSRKVEELCMSMQGETLTYQEKAYMMPKDPGLLAEVNQWLRQANNSGLLSNAFEQHLAAH